MRTQDDAGSQFQRRGGKFFQTNEEVHMDNDNDFVGGYAVPVDPMDDLQCDSCQ